MWWLNFRCASQEVLQDEVVTQLVCWSPDEEVRHIHRRRGLFSRLPMQLLQKDLRAQRQLRPARGAPASHRAAESR